MFTLDHEYTQHLPTCVLGYIHLSVTYQLSYCFLLGPFLFHTLTLSSLEQKEGSRHPGSLCCYISQHIVCTFVCMFPLWACISLENKKVKISPQYSIVYINAWHTVGTVNGTAYLDYISVSVWHTVGTVNGTAYSDSISVTVWHTMGTMNGTMYSDSICQCLAHSRYQE